MKIANNIKEAHAAFRGRISAIKERSALCRMVLNKYAIAFILFLIWICFLDNNSVGVWIAAERKLHEQKHQIEALESEISAKQARIERLNSQKDTLERFAREEYLFHEDGEDVFIVK